VVDAGDEGFHLAATGIVPVEQVDADEPAGQRREGDVGADPVHGGHAGSAGL